MRETSWNQIVKSNGLKAQGSLSVDLSDSLCELIIKALKLKSFTHRRNNKSRIPPEISSPWLINQLIRNYVRISNKSLSNFMPVIIELMVQLVIWVVQIIKSLTDIIRKIVFAPVICVAIRPIWQTRCIEVNLFAHWERKRFVTIELIHQPDWNTVSAKLFRQNVLVVVDQGVNACLSCCIHDLYHDIKVSLVVPILFRLNSCPHHSQPDRVESIVFENLNIFRPERPDRVKGAG